MHSVPAANAVKGCCFRRSLLSIILQHCSPVKVTKSACLLLQAKRSMHDAHKSCEAEVRAKEAATAAEAASQGAAAAAAVATASAERAAQTVANARVKLSGPIDDLADAVALLENTEQGPETSEVDGEAETLPEATVVQIRDLDPSAAKQMYALWETIESSYVKGAKIAFSGLRRLRQSCEQRMSDAQKIFAAHLLRPGGRQVEVTKFQTEYNAIDLDMRRVPEVQAELALQVRQNHRLSDVPFPARNDSARVLHYAGELAYSLFSAHAGDPCPCRLFVGVVLLIPGHVLSFPCQPPPSAPDRTTSCGFYAGRGVEGQTVGHL